MRLVKAEWMAMPERRDLGDQMGHVELLEKWDHPDYQEEEVLTDPKETMADVELKETMVKVVNPEPEDLQETQVFQETQEFPDQKEKLGNKVKTEDQESVVLLDRLETQVQLDPQEYQELLDPPELTAVPENQVVLEKKVPEVPTVYSEIKVVKDQVQPLADLGKVDAQERPVLRDNKDHQDHPVYLVVKENPVTVVQSDHQECLEKKD